MLEEELKVNKGLKFLVSHVLPLFRNLLDDIEPDVRAHSALVLPKMIQLVGPVLANVLFQDMFFATLKEKNYIVVEKLLVQVDIAVDTLR